MNRLFAASLVFLAALSGCAERHTTMEHQHSQIQIDFDPPREKTALRDRGITDPTATLNFKTASRDFEAKLYKLFVDDQTSSELKFEIRCSEPEPLLRSGIIIVRRWRPIIRGKEGGAVSFGTTFGMSSYEIVEPVTVNGATTNATVHYEVYMRRTPIERDPTTGKDKHLVWWFRNDPADQAPNRVDLREPGFWLFTRQIVGTPTFEASNAREYGNWTGVGESVQKAATALYARLYEGADQ